MAITVWRDLSGYADMKTGSALYYRQGILSHTPAKQRVAGPVGVMNSIKSTLAHAAAASYALVSINVGFSCLEGNGILGTPACAGMTTAAKLRIYHRLAVAMLLHLSCPGTAAHAQVLQRAAEAGGAVAHVAYGNIAQGILVQVLPVKRVGQQSQILVNGKIAVAVHHNAAALLAPML